MQIPYVDRDQIASALPYDSLIDALKNAFAEAKIETPMRHHHDFPNPKEGLDSTLLLMPSWLPGEDLGVKMVTVSPNNGKYDLPSIQGLYMLFDAHKGTPELLLDAKELTARRTAATSALASSFLSRGDAKTLFVIGTGALAPNLIRAHATVRPIEKVIVWGRSEAKAIEVTTSVSDLKLECETVVNISDGIKQADIITCATLSADPLIDGADLLPGQHVDLVGAYKKDMREANDEVLLRSRVFIDTDAALKETGDLFIPLQQGVITKEAIQADLFELCAGSKTGRQSVAEITCFKSVGHAMEDLVAASLVKKNLP